MKWIETFNICRDYTTRQKTTNKKALINKIQAAYMITTLISQYDRIRIFQTPVTQLYNGTSTQLEQWLERYQVLLHKSLGINHGS